MNVDCYVCLKPGRLRLDMHPPVVEHDRTTSQRKDYCALPPRDITHPAPQRKRRYPSPYKARAACTCDTRERAS